MTISTCIEELERTADSYLANEECWDQHDALAHRIMSQAAEGLRAIRDLQEDGRLPDPRLADLNHTTARRGGGLALVRVDL